MFIKYYKPHKTSQYIYLLTVQMGGQKLGGNTNVESWKISSGPTTTNATSTTQIPARTARLSANHYYIFLIWVRLSFHEDNSRHIYITSRCSRCTRAHTHTQYCLNGLKFTQTISSSKTSKFIFTGHPSILCFYSTLFCKLCPSNY